MLWALRPGEQMQLLPRFLALPRREGCLFISLTLKSRKGNAGRVIPGRTFSLLTRSLQVLAQLSDLSARQELSSHVPARPEEASQGT